MHQTTTKHLKTKIITTETYNPITKRTRIDVYTPDQQTKKLIQQIRNKQHKATMRLLIKIITIIASIFVISLFIITKIN